MTAKVAVYNSHTNEDARHKYLLDNISPCAEYILITRSVSKWSTYGDENVVRFTPDLLHHERDNLIQKLKVIPSTYLNYPKTHIQNKSMQVLMMPQWVGNIQIVSLSMMFLLLLLMTAGTHQNVWKCMKTKLILDKVTARKQSPSWQRTYKAAQTTKLLSD